MERRCGKCHTWKPLDREHFHRVSRQDPIGRAFCFYCIPCQREWALARYHRERTKPMQVVGAAFTELDRLTRGWGLGSANQEHIDGETDLACA